MDQLAKLRKVKANEAITLATQGKWQDAVMVNREIIEVIPDDVEALNRLGKALAETGRYAEARKALENSLQISPTNSIARKNLERMTGMEDAPIVTSARRVAPQVFLDESGKSITTALIGMPSARVLGQVHNGDVVQLEVDGHTVAVQNRTGQQMGRLEPRLAARLIRLHNGGNKYVAAVASVSHDRISVVVRETYQSAKMNGIVSFPPTGSAVPAYVADMDMGLDEDVDFDAMPSWVPLTDDSLVGDDAGDDPPPAAVKPQRSTRALHDEEVEDEEDEEIRV